MSVCMWFVEVGLGGGGVRYTIILHDIFKQSFRRECSVCISKSWMLCSEVAGGGGEVVQRYVCRCGI